jgi:uncharacterized protein YceK
MKKLYLLIAIIILLTACGKVSEDSSNDKALTPNVYDGNSVYVFTDTKTGCDYFIYASGYKGGITARLNSDGMPMCKSNQ